MNISSRKVDRYTVVSLDGMLNATTALRLKNGIDEVLPEKFLVIDLERVEFLDSSGLGALVGIARKIKANEAILKLAHLNERVRKVFEITRAFTLFDIYDDVLAAVESEGHL
jgi:anti-sigma B factor antagonist